MNKVKKKFNIIDLAIILIAVVIIGAVAFVLGVNTDSPQAAAKTMVMEVKQRSESFCSIPKEGDIILDASTKEEIGTLVSAKSVPATINAASAEEGKFVKSEIEGYYDLYLTIKLHSNPEVAKTGKSIYIQSKTYACSGYVIDVMESEEAE